MKLNSVLSFSFFSIALLGSTCLTSFADETTGSITTYGPSAAAIYKALKVEEVSGPFESPGGHPLKKFRTIKSIGGLICRRIEDFNPQIPDIYSCTLSAAMHAGVIYNSLGVTPVPLAPGSCGPSTNTKTVGGLTCEQTRSEELGAELFYSCELMTAS